MILKKINTVKNFNMITEIMLHQQHCICKYTARGSQMSFWTTSDAQAPSGYRASCTLLRNTRPSK